MIQNKCISYSLIFLFFILLIACKQKSEPVTSSSEGDQKMIIGQGYLIAEYVMANGEMSVVKGDSSESAKSQNFINEAMKEQNVDLKECSVKIIVNDFPIKFENSTDSSRLYQYNIDISNCKDNVVNEKIEEIQKKENYLKGMISSYEYPVTYYLYNEGQRIVLLGHYGLASYYKDLDQDQLVEELKKRD